MLDRNDIDNYITGHYGEDQELGEEDADEMPSMTPQAAIQQAIFDLCQSRHDWERRDDPNGVLSWIKERIACLEQAQRDLDELRRIKQALATLKGIL